VVSFAFTEEQQDFAKTLAEYSRKVLRPGYRERAASTEFPFGVLRQLGELGCSASGCRSGTAAPARMTRCCSAW
jgi:cyclohexanecarboxyl-CoA dehydrogenase